jgi:hypothetical protein
VGTDDKSLKGQNMHIAAKLVIVFILWTLLIQMLFSVFGFTASDILRGLWLLGVIIILGYGLNYLWNAWRRKLKEEIKEELTMERKAEE